jgi:predicted nucleic acid-binding protein
VRVVLDTNTLVSALLSPHGPPRRLLDDKHVLACAVAGNAGLIVSGDKHLLGLGSDYRGIRIVTPSEAIALVGR